MKNILKAKYNFFALFFVVVVTVFSCQKEISCETCRENNKPPIANAGADRIITLPTNTVKLDGSASSDPDGKISKWLWKKISGPASFIISKSSDSIANANNLTAGTYEFELTVIDNSGLSDKDTMMVTVDATPTMNHPPVANAGPDQTITLPANTVILDASGSSDPDYNIISYLWKKISGPPTSTITDATKVSTPATDLIEGVYEFEFTITDSGGLYDKDTVKITVKTPTPPPPPPTPPTSPSCGIVNRPLVNAQLVPIGKLSQAGSAISVGALNNKILFAGGNRNGKGSSRVDIYDIVANNWSTAELSLARIWIAPAAAGNKIFFAGGQKDDGWSSGNVDIYDVTTNTWSVSYLSRAADGLGSASVGNKVFFAGGNWGIGATNIVDIYDLTTNSWSKASISTSRNFVSGVSINNKVYFSGGYTSSFQVSNAIDIYDNSSNTWSTSVMQIPRAYHAAVPLNDKIFFAGGVTGSYPFSPVCSVETFDVNSGGGVSNYLFSPGEWFNGAGANAVIKDNKIVLLRTRGGQYANKFDVYDIATDTWSIGVLLQPVPGGSSVISVNNTIYVAGGIINGSETNQVWKLEF